MIHTESRMKLLHALKADPRMWGALMAMFEGAEKDDAPEGVETLEDAIAAFVTGAPMGMLVDTVGMAKAVAARI